MSDRPIQVGDVVMVVRGRKCGCPSASNGVIYKVASILRHCGLHECWHEDDSGYAAKDSSGRHFVGITRLKRIDPDALNESIPTKERIEV